MSEFPEFKKIPRLSRECVITEKIDGTNGLIGITYEKDPDIYSVPLAVVDEFAIHAGSKSRWLDTSKTGDNYGFAKWVLENAEELVKLGPGLHYGEWWGRGIQRNYGLSERRFSLFNTNRWSSADRPSCCDVVPILYQGEFDTDEVDYALTLLIDKGSMVSPGWSTPEGVIIYHIAANQYFKKTIEKDDERKTNI